MYYTGNFYNPEKETFTEKKDNIIDYLEKICRKIPLSETNLGIWMRAFHINLPIYLLFGVIFTPRWLASICIIIAIIIIVPFIYFKGCWLSLLEKRICKNDFNVVDAFIELSGTEINYNDKLLLYTKRYKTTLLVFSIYIPTIFGIYYYRFM